MNESVFNGPRGLIVCVEVKERICDILTAQISTAASSFTPRESLREFKSDPGLVQDVPKDNEVIYKRSIQRIERINDLSQRFS